MRTRLWFFLLVLLSLPALSACSLRHIDELLILKQYGDEAEAQDADVEFDEARFLRLLGDIKDGRFEADVSQQAVLDRYGEPTYVERVDASHEEAAMWMYRRPVHFFDSDQVLLYFNEEGKLISHTLKRYQPGSGN